MCIRDRYLPDQGVAFIYNDILQGVIDSDAFSRAIFLTWFGSDPVDMKVKEALLGKNSILTK